MFQTSEEQRVINAYENKITVVYAGTDLHYSTITARGQQKWVKGQTEMRVPHPLCEEPQDGVTAAQLNESTHQSTSDAGLQRKYSVSADGGGRGRHSDAEVFGAFVVQPSLGLRELVGPAARCVVVVVVVRHVVVWSVVLHHAVVLTQSGRCRGGRVQIVSAVGAVGGRVPLHSKTSLRRPVHLGPLLSPL